MRCVYAFTLPGGWTCRLVIRLLNQVYGLWWRSELVTGGPAGVFVRMEHLVLKLCHHCLFCSVVNLSLEQVRSYVQDSLRFALSRQPVGCLPSYNVLVSEGKSVYSY